MHQHAKFRHNRSIGCEDIKIFPFFKMTAAAILDFRNREFLFTVGIWRVQAHHCTKFRQNRSFRCGDIAIFRFFKMAGVSEYLGVSITLQNLVMIDAVVFISRLRIDVHDDDDDDDNA